MRTFEARPEQACDRVLERMEKIRAFVEKWYGSEARAITAVGKKRGEHSVLVKDSEGEILPPRFQSVHDLPVYQREVVSLPRALYWGKWLPIYRETPCA